MKKPILSIVVPCYNEEEVLPLSSAKLLDKLKELVNNGLVSEESFLLFVDDGSKDHTWDFIDKLHSENPHRWGLKLAGNVGHQNALLSGITIAKEYSDISISIDADLQDDIEVMNKMVELYLEGCDIVYGVRNSRETDSWFKRNTAQFFYSFMKSMGVKTIYNHADYRLMSKRAMNQLCQYREKNLFLRGIVPLIGYKTERVYYSRSERLAGDSKYPLKKMLALAINGITSFSSTPIRMISIVGGIFILISIAVLIYVIVALTNGIAVGGWASIMLSIWFIGGIILICMGLIGEYISKIFVEVKGRPLFNIETLLK